MIWQTEKQWADAFMPEIKAILGMHIIGEAPREEDAERNTDLIVLKMEPIRIAVRMRRKHHALIPQYLEEFTIRCHLASGAKTELRKIMEGFGHLMFYGFEHQDGGRLGRWTLIDLNVFRVTLFETLTRTKKLPGFVKPNRDGSSDFRVFRYADFPREMIRTKGNGFPQFSRPTAKAIELTYADIPF